VEQEEVVNSITRHLPKGMLLVLKEHPHQFEKLLPRSRNFYSRLVSAPNVVLVSSDVPSLKLRQGCLAVVTVSGSNGFEVLASGKPVIAFGSAPWREAPGVHTVRSDVDAKQAIDDIVVSAGQPRSSYADFLDRLRNATFHGDLSGPTGGRPEHELTELAAATRHNVGLVISTWLELR
jgi:capsule polysaccharide export protein KpsC/LpsZ